MIVEKLTVEPLALARALNKKRHLVWLDSACYNSPLQAEINSEHSFSLLAFDSCDEKVFDSNSSLNDLSIFFQNNSQTKKNPFPEFAFTGGWVGYLAYEAYQFNKKIPLKPQSTKNYPLAVFRYYDTFVYVDHLKNDVFFVSFSKNAKEKWKDLCLALEKENTKALDTSGFSVGEIKTNISRKTYNSGFESIKKSLVDGDYFELNYTMEFETSFAGSPLDLFLCLRNTTKAPMMSYIDFPEVKILSSSPERFFQIQENRINMFPIKGTIKRGANPEDDEKQKQILFNSHKDQAELLMVTDMLRNDLGRVCKTGSVSVDSLSKVHTFSHYHHLVAKITGLLENKVGLVDVFEAVFPCGSITGAPKIKVMEHIEKLENRARGVYTGAIGFISDNGYADFSVPIRTITIQDAILNFATGGGIVADSDCDQEYDECLVKAAGIMEAMGKTVGGG